MTKIICFLLIAGFLFGNVYKFSFFSQDVHLSLLDTVVILLTILIIALKHKLITKKLVAYRILFKPLLVFSGFSLASLLIMGSGYGSTALVVGFFYWARWNFYSVFFILLSCYLSNQSKFRLLTILGLGTAALGLLQYWAFPDVRNLAVSEWDPHYFRIVGTFLDPGFTGLILVFTLILISLRPFKSQLLNLLAWGGTYLALALTYSRSSYLAYLIAMAYLAWVRKSKLFFLLVVFLFLLTLSLLPRSSGGEGVNLERTSSIQARITNWQHSLKIISDHPSLGVGFNTYRYAQANYGFLDSSKWLVSHAGAGADSSLLFVAATTGLVGLIVYLWYLSSLCRFPAVRYYLFPLLVHSFFLNSLFYPPVLLWLALLLTASKSLSHLSSFDFPFDRSL